MYEILFYIIPTLLVAFLFSILFFYVNKFLKNVKKNEKLVWSLIFVHPSTPKAMKVLTISVLLFSILWIIRLIKDFFGMIVPFLTQIGTYIALIGYIYFFKTLVKITEEK